MVDFIIVGRGLAATALMHAFYQNGISFRVIGVSSMSNCSRVAAGIWNPVVFKRMTASWLAGDLIAELMRFYPECEKTLKTKLITLRQIVKPFTEEQEKELWAKKAPGDLAPFLVEEIQYNITGMEGLKIPNGYGLVESGGNLDVAKFLDASATFFRDRITEAVFDHGQLTIKEDGVKYGETEARNIIFCEGHLMTANPLLSWIPLAPAKGEIAVIESEEIHLRDRVFSRDGFLVDIDRHKFILGATFDWDQLDDKPTQKGLKSLTQKIRRMTGQPYQVVSHEAGVRPSTNDRRPIIGRHPAIDRVFVFNGLGARGVMLAPFFAGKFVLFYLKNEALVPEADVSRFYNLYERV